tara:strand:- start:607 stop:1632 length:1026 start_codon:yes stop_codon:yes gene_type:complete
MLISSIKLNEPIKKNYPIKTDKPKFFYLKKAFFYPTFFKKIVGIVFDENKRIIKNWHYNDVLSTWSFHKCLSFSFLKYDFFINTNLLYLSNFFNKKKHIMLHDRDIVLFGAWPNIYYHKIIDFILRINFIKKHKYRRIYVPIFLKNILKSNPYKKVFSKLNINYYDYKSKITFNNLRYVSAINYYRDNKVLRNTILNLQKSVINNNKLASDKYKYSLISRKKSTRGLENEDALFSMLKRYNFKRYYFENLSYLDQIKVCYNSKIVIGVQGSGLANMIYMKKKAHFIQLSNIYINNPQIRELAISTGLNWHDINFSHNYRRNFKGRIDILKVEKKVKSILKI